MEERSSACTRNETGAAPPKGLPDKACHVLERQLVQQVCTPPFVLVKKKETALFATYLVVTLVTSAVNGMAAIANLIGHEYPKSQADRLQVPRSWMRPLGALLAAGALGLLAGLAVPVLGTLAAAGLVLYFLGAFCAHLRVHDHQLGPWAVYFCLAVTALALNLAYHGHR